MWGFVQPYKLTSDPPKRFLFNKIIAPQSVLPLGKGAEFCGIVTASRVRMSPPWGIQKSLEHIISSTQGLIEWSERFLDGAGDRECGKGAPLVALRDDATRAPAPPSNMFAHKSSHRGQRIQHEHGVRVCCAWENINFAFGGFSQSVGLTQTWEIDDDENLERGECFRGLSLEGSTLDMEQKAICLLQPGVSPLREYPFRHGGNYEGGISKAEPIDAVVVSNSSSGHSGNAKPDQPQMTDKASLATSESELVRTFPAGWASTDWNTRAFHHQDSWQNGYYQEHPWS
ncbi:hypothetical protein BJV78DRAFT_1305519 [Lactifluus subvellereus]|nr:hypothetical protein BJV78DRAFT_1305519 [Lactifluus subvellereus]